MTKYLFLLLFINSAFAECNELYVDRIDYFKKENLELDIADEYYLEKEKTLTNKNVIDAFIRMTPRLKFNDEKKLNKDIKTQFIQKIKKNIIKYSKIKNLQHQKRLSFFAKEAFNNEYYYSFIFYTNIECEI